MLRAMRRELESRFIERERPTRLALLV